MYFARRFSAVALAAALAGCSGNLGGGESTLPGSPGSVQNGTNVQQVAQAAPTASPVSASNVATLGGSASPQALPPIGGWAGTIAFPKPAPTVSPSPKAGSSVSDSPASIGLTASLVEPSDAPPFGAKKHVKHVAGQPAGLYFISLLATADVTFAQYPRIIVDVPRDVAALHQHDIFALALYDPEQKDKAFRLAAADRDLSVTAADLPAPSATPLPSPSASAPIFPNAPAVLTPPPTGEGLNASGLPPQAMAFVATPATLTLKENVPLVFALYALAPTPAPSASSSSRASTAGTPSAAPIPSATASAAAAASATPSTAPTGTPTPH